MNNKVVKATSVFLVSLLVLILIGCTTSDPAIIQNREDIATLYIAALENRDADAIVALHAPNNPPAPDTLALKLAQLGDQPIEVTEMTFLSEFGENVTAVTIKGKLGEQGRTRTDFTERFTLSRRQDGGWYLVIGAEQ